MSHDLQKIKNEALAELAKLSTMHELDAFVVNYFGRSGGKLNTVLRSLKDLGDQERRSLGSEANAVKVEIWKQIDVKRNELKNAGKKQFVDLTAATERPRLGHLHPLTLARREMEEIFKGLGFAVMEGPDIESDYYTFEALNIPVEHPARDMWDTFHIKGFENAAENRKMVLKPHTSPMQVKVMEKHEPPFAVIVPGRVFRHEATDARHEHTFDQLEGFLVDENVTLANLKWILNEFFKQLFGEKIEIKLRPSYFPFTEPSIEVAVSCIFCSKKGCSVCHTGWLEMLGAGMIHQKVFEFAGYPKDKYSGFAFGIGISRIAMLKYDIPDIRMLYQNDQRLLNQF